MVVFDDKDDDGLLVTELDTQDPTPLEVVQRLWYYPFGMQMGGVGADRVARPVPGQMHRYNGKELDGATSVYEYGFRYYDPAAGRFTGVDPIASQFPHVSVFNYAENDPIRHIDLHGLQKAIPPIGAMIGGGVRAGYEQLKYSIWRNLQDDPSSIPYREYGVDVNEYTGEANVTYKEFSVEPSLGKRLMDNSFAGLDILSIIPTKGAGVQAFAKIPGWWPFAKGVASKSELLADGGKCAEVACAVQSSIGGVIVKIENKFLPGRAGIGAVKNQSGDLIVEGTEWKEHFTVFKDGKFYDGLTGPNGLDLKKYSALFEDWDYLNKSTSNGN